MFEGETTFLCPAMSKRCEKRAKPIVPPTFGEFTLYCWNNMSRLEQFIDTVFSHHRWLVHLLYWIVILLLFILFFGRQNSNYLQTAFFVGLLMPIVVSTTYFLNYHLVPRFLLRDHYIMFAVYFTYTLIVAMFLELIIVLVTFIFLAGVNIRNMTPASIDTFFLLTSTLMVAFLSIAIKLLLHFRRSKENFEKLQKEKIETELKFLKAQLNPHFLFNTLNNLYFLATEKSDRAPTAILQLSEMLDYILNTSKENLVPFTMEWAQVRNYIALESLRYEDRLSVSLEINGDPTGQKIAPMIVLSLVENAFKHGVMAMTGKSWLQLRVALEEEKINILVRNSQRASAAGHGIGLQNLRAQLELIYRKQYELLIEDAVPDEYAVNLTLNV